MRGQLLAPAGRRTSAGWCAAVHACLAEGGGRGGGAGGRGGGAPTPGARRVCPADVNAQLDSRLAGAGARTAAAVGREVDARVSALHEALELQVSQHGWGGQPGGQFRTCSVLWGRWAGQRGCCMAAPDGGCNGPLQAGCGRWWPLQVPEGWAGRRPAGGQAPHETFRPPARVCRCRACRSRWTSWPPTRRRAAPWQPTPHRWRAWLGTPPGDGGRGGPFRGKGGGHPSGGRRGARCGSTFGGDCTCRPPPPSGRRPPTITLFSWSACSSAGHQAASVLTPPPPPPQVADLFQQLATSAADSSAAALAPVRQQLAGQGEQLAQLAAGARAEAAATAGEGGQLPGSCRGEREGEAVPRLSTRNLT